MSYLLLLHRDVDRHELAEALADMLALPASAVDVGGDGAGDRNWGAPVSCTVTSLDGDMPIHLDIYIADTVPAPTEEEAAAWLAARLRTLVAYEAVPLPPNHWMVGPDGQRTRAKFLDYDEDGRDLTGYRIVATEAHVPGLADVSVAPLPEVIREYRMPIPLTDALEAKMQPPAEPGQSAWYATRRLGAWEAMVARLMAGWHPDGWYPAHYYREDLEIRDALSDAASVMPESVRADFEQALAEVDRRFAEATEDDGGQALAGASGPVPDRWWWRRITHPTPWQKMPGLTAE